MYKLPKIKPCPICGQKDQEGTLHSFGHFHPDINIDWDTVRIVDKRPLGKIWGSVEMCCSNCGLTLPLFCSQSIDDVPELEIDPYVLKNYEEKLTFMMIEKWNNRGRKPKCKTKNLKK